MPVRYFQLGFVLALLCGMVAGCGDEIDKRPARWSYIFPAIIEPNCATASCHSKLSAAAGLEYTGSDESCLLLVGPQGRGNLVVPGDPAQSKLMYLLRGIEIRRMPPDAPLPNRDIALIERW